MTDEVFSSPAAAPDASPAAPVAPAASAPATQVDPAQTPASPAAEAPKPKREGGFQKRIAELTARLRQTERDRDEWREHAKKPSQPSVPQPLPAAPKMSQFESLEDYLEARDQYRDAVREAKQQQARAEKPDTQQPKSPEGKSEAQEEMRLRTELLVEEGAEKYEDFGDLIADNSRTFTEAMAHYAFNSDRGVDVTHYLLTNQKEAQRIARLNPVQQFAELGRLEDRIATRAVQPKKPAEPPAPVDPVSGAITSPGMPSPSKTEDWIKARQAKVHGPRK